jgi:hypothetical protein
MKVHLFSQGLALLLTLSLLPVSGVSAAALTQYDWQQGSSLPQPVGDGALFALAGKLFYAGGWAGEPVAPYSATYAAPLNNQVPGLWSYTGNMPGGGRFGVAAASGNSRAYVLGGNNGTSDLNRVESFDGTNWHTEPSLPQALHFPGAAIAGNRLHVAGGLPGPTRGAWSAVIGSDGSLQGWQAEANLPMELITRLASWNSCLYAVGGKDLQGHRRAEIYRGILNADGTVAVWSPLTNLPEPLAFNAIAVRQGRLHVIAGETTGGATSKLVYSASIAPDCSLSPWNTMDLPNGTARQRVAATASEYGLYFAAGQPYTGTYFQDSWYHVIPHVSISVSSEPSTPVQEGSIVRYNMNYAVTGNGIAQSVRITNALPAKTQLVNGSINPPGAGNESGGVITWNLGDLTAGAPNSPAWYQARVTCSHGTVSALVFDDLDGDGMQDNNEAGRSGVTVRLLRQGTVLRSTTTDASGAYVFTNVSLGSYDVEVVSPVGSFATTGGRFPVTVADTGDCRTGVPLGVRYCSRLTAAADPPVAGAITLAPAPNCSGGTGGQPLYNPGTVVNVTVKPESGYKFIKWIGDAGVTQAMPLIIKMDKDKAATATFGIDCFALGITQSGGGGVDATPKANCPSQAGLYLNTTQVTLTARPNLGYAFQGWTGDAAGPERIMHIVVDRTINVGAVFAACYPLVTEINIPGAGGVNPTPTPNCQGGGTQLYNPGTQVALRADASENYAFESWNGSLTGQDNPVTVTMDSGKTITAGFAQCVEVSTGTDPESAAKAVVVTPHNCPGGGETYQPGSSVEITTQTDSPYFFFKQWQSSAGVISPRQRPSATWTLSNTNAVAIAAYDSCKTLTLAIYPDGWGSIGAVPPPNCGPDRYLPGTPVLLTANPVVGHHLIGWNGDVVGTSDAVGLVMDRDKSVTALFDINCYSLSSFSSPSDGGSIHVLTPSNCGRLPQMFLHGTTVTLTVSSAVANKFVTWAGDASGTVTRTVLTMNRDKTVMAMFTSCFALSTAVDPADYGGLAADPPPNCEGGGAGYYNPGTTVQLTATPARDRAFSQWSGAASGTLNVTGVVMNAPKNAVANFRPCLKVSTANQPQEGGISTVGTPANCPGGGDTYAPLSRIILSGSPNLNYVFDHWEMTGGQISDPTAPNAILTLGTTDVAATSVFGACRRLNATASPVGWGTVNASPAPNCGADRYLPGTSVALTAVPATGKVFKQWGGGAVGAGNPIIVTLDRDLDVNAEFQIACVSLSTVPLPSASAGSIAPLPAPNCATQAGRYNYGTVVTVRAIPAQGYAFTGWTGSLMDLQNPMTVTLTTDFSLAAQFAGCYPLSTDVTPKLDGTVTALPLPNCEGGGPGLYNPGSNVELLATAANNYVFSYWTGDALGVDNPVNLVMSRALNVTAVFSATASLPTLIPDPVRVSGASQDPSTVPSATRLARQRGVVLDNQGAYAYWTFDGISFWCKSGSYANHPHFYLPLVVR